MKLLIKKSKSGRGDTNSISIGKSRISIKGTQMDRVIYTEGNTYGSVGINDDGNLCLYTRNQESEHLFKVSYDKQKSYAYISINAQEHKNMLKAYQGSYEISVIRDCMEDWKEIVLIKLNK